MEEAGDVVCDSVDRGPMPAAHLGMDPVELSPFGVVGDMGRTMVLLDNHMEARTLFLGQGIHELIVMRMHPFHPDGQGLMKARSSFTVDICAPFLQVDLMQPTHRRMQTLQVRSYHRPLRISQVQVQHQLGGLDRLDHFEKCCCVVRAGKCGRRLMASCGRDNSGYETDSENRPYEIPHMTS